jgi:hypothetical protein
MKGSVTAIVLMILILAATSAFAASGANYSSQPSVSCAAPTTYAYQQPAPGCSYSSAGNAQAMTTDDSYVYVVSGNMVSKFRKCDMTLVSQTPLCAPVPSGYGAGPSEWQTPIWGSGSRVDVYAPSGAPNTPVDRYSESDNFGF